MQLVPISLERAPVGLSSPLEPFEKRHLVLDIALSNLQSQELVREPKKRRYQKCILGEGFEISLQVMVGILSVVALIVQYYETLDQNKDNCRTPYRLLLLMALLTVAASSNTIVSSALEFLRGKSKKKTAKFKENCIERAAIIGNIRWSLSQAIHLSASELRNSYLTQCLDSIQKLPAKYMETHPETADLLILLKDLLAPAEFAKLLPSKQFEDELLDADRFIHLERDYLVVDIGLSVLQNKEPSQSAPKSLYQKIIFWEGTKILLLVTVNSLAIASFAVQIDDTIKEDQKKCLHSPHLMFLLGASALISTVNTVSVSFFEWLKRRTKNQIKRIHQTNREVGITLGKIRVALAKGIHASTNNHRISFLNECIKQIQNLPENYKDSQEEIQKLLEMLCEFMPNDEKLMSLTRKVEPPLNQLPLKLKEADV